jgi:phosphoglycolate phosphatase-like HAD superfamily hydrolase
MYKTIGNDIRIYNQNLELGKIKYAIFDFDGTISILREGWERIMEPVMIESICGNSKPTDDILTTVKDFIDETTGIQTILQMEGLVDLVKKTGLLEEKDILDAKGYKKIYNDRLMKPVNARIKQLQNGEKTLADYTLLGALVFCKSFCDKNIKMYLASGTDRDDVRNEAEKVTAAQFFKGGIYGAIGSIEDYSKDKVMKQILADNNLAGNELIVFGDGPVEIRNAKENGAIAVGVASDEERGHGWNESKIKRLSKADCDILIPDFNEGDTLLKYLFNEL